MFKKILALLIILFLLGISVWIFAQPNNSKVGTSDTNVCISYNCGAHIDRNLNGDLMAIWQKSGENAIFWSVYDELFEVWSPPQVLMAGANDVRYSALTADETGNFHAAFSIDDFVYHSKYDGISWSTPVLVQKDSLASRLGSILIDTNGYIWISWNTYDEPDADEYLFVARSEDGGNNWSDVDTLGGDLIPDLPTSYCYPMLAAGPNGIVGTVYRERDDNISTNYQVYFQEWNGSEWSAPELITDYHSDSAERPGGVDVYWSSLAYDSNGKRHAVFYTSGSDWPHHSGNQAFYIANDGSGWTDPVPISQSTDGTVVYPVIRIDGDDNMYVAWIMDQLPDTTWGRVAGQVYYTTSNDGGNTWEDPTQLSTNTHYNTEGAYLQSTNLSRHIWPAGIGGTSYEGGVDCLWAEEDTTLTTGDTYQIYYGRIPLVYTAVEEKTSHNIPDKFELKQNYPNPFNPTTTISFSVPKNGHVSLTVYSLLGQEIATLVSKNLTAGNYNITWNAVDNHGRLAPSGMYFYKLESKNQVKTRKLLLLK